MYEPSGHLTLYGILRRRQETAISGLILPRADRPARWDFAAVCLPDLVASLKIKQLKLETLIPFQGPAIKGKRMQSSKQTYRFLSILHR